MNILLDKFDNIKMDNQKRLSEEDYKFCENAQLVHEKVIKQLKNSYETILKLYQQEENFYSSIRSENENLKFGKCFFSISKEEFAEDIINEQNKLNTKIVSFFKSKYKVTLEGRKINHFSKIEKPKEKEINYCLWNLTGEEKEEMKARVRAEKELYDKELQEYLQKCIDYKFHYNVILDDLFHQLGGMTFRQKSDEQTKAILQDHLEHKSIKLNKLKVSIESFFYLDSFDIRYKDYNVSYNCDKRFLNLLIAISHFCYGSTDFVNSNLYDLITRGKNDEIFKIHKVNNVVQLKLFKNGKIELTFQNHEQAEKFAKEYCGYIENNN